MTKTLKHLNKIPKKNTLKYIGKLKMHKIEKKTAKNNSETKESSKMKVFLKRRKKINIKKPIMNKQFIELLGRLEELMTMKGENFRARAYHKAAESIMLYPNNITNIDQLQGLSGIGKTILKKFQEFQETGTLQILEKAKTNPIYQFTQIYGIGPKKAKQLVEKNGITTITDLRKKKDELLNNVQKKGLKYYEDILKRIPRAEIGIYKEKLEQIFKMLPSSLNSSFEIVGSYRRGNAHSGDIDIIITNKDNNDKIFTEFLNALVKKGILIEILSKGKIKSLTIGRIDNYPARRLDFMYSSPNEYAFAILYFTGSKSFNVVMRQRAVNMGYTMNEHGLNKLVGKKKGAKLDLAFSTEKSIFEFLGMVYKTPVERIDGRAVVLKKPIIKLKWRRTLKIKKQKFAIKEHLLEFKKQGISVLKKLNETQLSAMLLKANDAYYNKKPILGDNVYDILKEYIEHSYPENKAIHMVGAPIEKNKVKLPYEMWSMDKIKPDTKALSKWLRKYPAPYVISGKLDGISALYISEDGESKLYTRGNHYEGTDISYLIPYLKFPQEQGLAIRGELVIARKTFNEKYEGSAVGKYKNARNFITGVVVSAKKREPEKWRDIDFVAYEVIKPELKMSKQMEWLKKHNVITVIHTNQCIISNESLSKLLVEWRENGKYEYDGIVVISDKIYPRDSKNPMHAFAFKMVLSDQKAEAKVLDVIWSPSKDGFLKPVIQIEQIRLKGVDIEYATAYNAKFIEDNKIGIGALVQMVRSGDVIPKILAVIKPSEEPKMPNVPWKWNTTHVDALLIDATSNEIVKEKNITGFFKRLEVDGLGTGNIKRIMQSGFSSIPAILRMSELDFLKVKGFKEKMASKVYRSIHKQMEEVDLSTLMAATNIFGRGMGARRMREILKNYPKILESPQSHGEKVEKISKINGFAKKTAESFVRYIPTFMEFIHETGLERKLIIIKPVSVKSGHPLFEKKIVITGFRDKILSAELIKLGAKLTTSVGKNTFIVLVKNMDEDTGKAEKARHLGIPVMTSASFRKKFYGT